jgi:hypothetical protein
VKRSGSPVGASPTRLTQSLQPVAIGAAVEATKPPEPSRKTGRSSDSASSQAVTRVNVEQAPKGLMWKPTRPQYGEGRSPWGNEARASRSDINQGFHRGNDDGMRAHGEPRQHGKPQRREARSQPDSREGQAGPPGVADRLVVPRKPGNSGGGKGPEFKEAARRGKGQGEWCKPVYLPIKRSRSEGGDPQSPRVSRRSSVLPCPRAGCGKSACPVR